MDKTDLMVEVMYRELEDFHKIEKDFVSEFSKQDFDWIVKVNDTITVFLSILCLTRYTLHFFIQPKYTENKKVNSSSLRLKIK